MNEFIRFLNKYNSLEKDIIESLEKVVYYKTYACNEIIFSENQICNAIRFVVSGSARSYFINSDGQEYTWFFHFNDQDSKFENFFVLDYLSFLRQAPSSLSCEVINELTVVELPYRDLYNILNSERGAGIGTIYRIMTEQAYCSVHKRAFSLLTDNAKERYLKLLKEESYLFNKFQHYRIASYLGVATQSLSRLKKEVLNK